MNENASRNKKENKSADDILGFAEISKFLELFSP